MARQILWRAMQSVGYHPTCNLVIYNYHMDADRRHEILRSETQDLIALAKALPRAPHLLASDSHALKFHRRDKKGWWWMPEHAVICVPVEKHTAWASLRLHGKPALCLGGDITSSVKALHCKHNSDHWPGQRAVRALRPWHTQQECSRAGSGLPLTTNMYITEALTLHILGECWFFFLLHFIFKNLCVTHWNNCTT